MTRLFTPGTIAFFLLLPATALPGEMKDELTVGKAHGGEVRTLFGTYGYQPRRAVLLEPGGVRIRLPAGVADVAQTGAYSVFTLSGDCEVSVAYALLNVPAPQEGYGSGVGLAFDAGEGIGRGSIQRMHQPSRKSSLLLQTVLGKKDAQKEELRTVPATARRGRIGLRRIGKELIFLKADDHSSPLEEIERLPFTDGTIRAVRFYADLGGSPTGLDAWVGQIQVRAEEITGGIPKSEARGPRWWLWGGLMAAGLGVGFWGWRAYRRE